MAQVVVSMKIMPDSPAADLKKIESKATHEIAEFGGSVGKVDVEPVAFGLKSLVLIFVMDESLGSTETLEESVSKIPQVQSVEITDVRRAIG
ncbi:MAG: elongation factor 1-beta [Candidatus Woesearchaeota archaeon]